MKRFLHSLPLLILFTLSPLVFNTYGKWIYELPKARIIYIGIALSILVAIWYIRVLHTSRLAWVVFGFLGMVFITGVAVSPVPEQSFWGTYTRQLGFIGYLHLLLFPFFLSELLKKAGTKLLYKMIAWGSLGTSLLALAQYTSFSPFAVVDSFGFRLYGSFGEPNLLGYYLVLTLFPVWQTFQEYSWRNFQRYFYLSVLLISSWTIIDSGSRGAMLGLVAALVLVTIHYTKNLLKNYRKYLLIAISTLLVVLVGLVSWQLQDKHSFVSLRILNNATIAIRMEIWKTTLIEANRVWWKGHGLENLSPVFKNKSPPLKKLLYDPNETIDRAHNDVLDHYYSGGIWLLLAYLILIGSPLFYSLQLWRDKQQLVPFGILIQYIIISSVGPVHSSHILFLALAIGLIHAEEKHHQVRINILLRFLISILLVALTYWHTQAVLDDFK